MGHINFNNLVKISRKRVVRDTPDITKSLNSICKHCQHGNQKTKDDNILFVENIKNNLLNVIQMCHQGHTLAFD